MNNRYAGFRGSPRTFRWQEYLREKKKRRRQGGVLLLGLVLIIAWMSCVISGAGYYVAVSFLMIFGILGIFFGHFERRKPMAREVVLLATMTGFCVILNEINIRILPVHADTALVVICGIALGPEAGFLVGAISRLICNFFSGQGPWTPWQMVAWGMIGYLAGLAFNKMTPSNRFDDKKSLADRLSLQKETGFYPVIGPAACILLFWVLAYLLYIFTGNPQEESFWGWRLYVFGVLGMITGCVLQRKRLPVNPVSTTVFTFMTVFLLYGGLMNFAAMLMEYQLDPEKNHISWESLKLLYLTGVPYDAAHALGASFCMFFFGESLLKKLQRIQIKFGIIL